MSFLSVVTVHLDDLPGLALTQASLEHLLGNGQVQWLVIDGGTVPEDATGREILRRAKASAAHFVSETDDGIYDAMNKGTQAAGGQYVIYLNAGDEIHPDFSVHRLAAIAQDAGFPGMVWAKCVEVHADLEEVELRTRPATWAWYGMPLTHAAILFRREILGSNPYDLGYSIAADYHLVCQLLGRGVRPLRVDMFAARFHRGGLSERQHRQTLLEEHRVRCHYFPDKRWVSPAIMHLKRVLQYFSRFPALRRLWRKRI